MSIIRETKWNLLELFPDQKATEGDAEIAARAQAIADAKAKAEAEIQAKAEAEAKAKAKEAAAAEKAASEGAAPDEDGKKPLSAIDEAAEELASIDLVPKKESEEETAADLPEEIDNEPENDDPPVSLEPEGDRPNGVQVKDYTARGVHIDVLCAPDQVVDAAKILDEADFTLEAVTGVDWIKEEAMEVVYDYSRTDDQFCRVAVRVRLSRSAPEVPTVSEVYPGANWHERETHEFFGIKFQGHPYLVPLLLPEDADFHPLLKDFTP